MSQVNVIVHYRYGIEVRTVTLQGVERIEAEEFVKEIATLRRDDSALIIGLPDGRMKCMVPARNVEFVEVTEL